MKGGIKARRRPNATPDLDTPVPASLLEPEDPARDLPWIVSRPDPLFYAQVASLSRAYSLPHPATVPTHPHGRQRGPRAVLVAIPDEGFDWGSAWKRVRVERQGRKPGVYLDALGWGHLRFGSFDQTERFGQVRIWAPTTQRPATFK